MKNNEKYIGMTVKSACGLGMTVYAVTDNGRLCVRFSDGRVKNNVSRADFLAGNVAPSPKKKATEYVGMSERMSCGLMAEIVKSDGGSADQVCTVRFQDGTIRNARRTHFKKGYVAHPAFGTTNISSKMKTTYAGFDISECVYKNKRGRYTCYRATCRKCGKEEILTPVEMLMHYSEHHQKKNVMKTQPRYYVRIIGANGEAKSVKGCFSSDEVVACVAIQSQNNEFELEIATQRDRTILNMTRNSLTVFSVVDIDMIRQLTNIYKSLDRDNVYPQPQLAY